MHVRELVLANGGNDLSVLGDAAHKDVGTESVGTQAQIHCVRQAERSQNAPEIHRSNVGLRVADTEDEASSPNLQAARPFSLALHLPGRWRSSELVQEVPR